MAKYSKTLGMVLLAIGILESVFIWINGSFLLFLIAIVSAFINSFIYFVAGELDERLEAIEKKTNNLSPGININDSNTQSYITDRRLLDNGGWRCTGCGRINASYVGTCACGANKNDY